ncbi:conjugal transfer protein [Pediococcus pentosaceus]|uniref:Conjugal transfer protein n=1 Tax=Pediococcus pentosaceus TaxID=1255 RepID=A0AA41C0Z3_PEDPE|nr:conjugal transfer protein [Pediococcus pentosaceus]MBF7128048.1 conjugal transfer protein [Pediococcus pentosaceus]
MAEKIFTGVKKSIPYLIMLLVGLYLAILLTALILALAEYKLQITDHFTAILKQVSLRPVHYYMLYLTQKQPPLIIISIVTVLYTLYFGLKRQSKSKEWKTANTDTHGSATWGNVKDLLTQYFTINSKDLSTQFNKSLKQETLKKLQAKGEEK